MHEQIITTTDWRSDIVITVQVNPPQIDDEYLSCLNLAYNPWGNRQQFEWCFRRESSYPDPDLVVLKIDNEMAAGSGVTYRRVTFAGGSTITVGLVTGAWTLPQFRDQGCFARVIQECVQVTRRKGGALLFGFVRADNASSRQMERLGSAMVPSKYLRSQSRASPQDGVHFQRVPKNAEVLATLFNKFTGEMPGRTRFDYATVADFSAQFIDRPSATEILTDGRGNFGVIESRDNYDVLQLIISERHEQSSRVRVMEGFLSYVNEKGRLLLSFLTDQAMVEAAIAAGFEVSDGYLAVLIADDRSLNEAMRTPIHLTEHDSKLLAQPAGAYFPGPWDIQSGDRM